MSFWDNFAGGVASGLVAGGKLGMDLKQQGVDSQLAINRDDRTQAAEDRAAESRSWERDERRSLESIAGVELGAPAQPVSAGIDMPEPAAPSTPAPARSAIPAPAAAPAPAPSVSGGDEYEARISGIKNLAQQGGVSKTVAAARIEAIKKERTQAAKDALDADVKRQQISASKTAQSVAQQGLTESQWKFKRQQADTLYESAHAKVASLNNPNMSVADPQASSIVNGALDDLKRMHDNIDDGKTAEIVRGKDGVTVRLMDEKSGELIEEMPIKTVADLQRVDTISRQIAKGEGAAKYAAASLADRVAADIRPVLERGLKADAETATRQSEVMPRVMDGMKRILNASTEEKLTPEYRQFVNQLAQEAELILGDKIAPPVKVPVTDPKTGEPLMDDSGKPVTREIRQNKITLLAAMVEPNTKIKLPDGTSADASIVVEEVMKDAPRLIRESGGDMGSVGMTIYQQLLQGGVDDEAAQILAQQAVANLAPAVKQAIAPAATPAAIQMPGTRPPTAVGSAGGINPNNPRQPLRPASSNPRDPGYALPAR
jgi:hypothetical protein